MIVITGATGNTGSAIAEKVLAAGEKVRVVGRSAEKLQRFVAKGAEGFAGDVADADAMTRAFTGATAVYLLIPPSLKVENVAAYQDSVVQSLATAVEKAAVRYAVLLSSIGADQAEKVGPIKGLQRFEQRLNRISGLNLLRLRAGFFMENLFQYIGVIKSMGMIAGTMRGDLASPWIATRDIAAAAAEALWRRDFSGQRTRELLGPRDLTMDEIATLVGKGIGRERLSYSRLPALVLKPAMIAMGLSADVVANMLEMFEGVNQGLITPLAPRSAESTTPTTFEEFVAQEFVPRYEGKAAAAH